MSKHTIAWLPGDGVGTEVMEAAKLCLDALKFNAEYIHGDIGWEFWKHEGNPLPGLNPELFTHFVRNNHLVFGRNRRSIHALHLLIE